MTQSGHALCLAASLRAVLNAVRNDVGLQPGLSIGNATKILGVDEGTLRRWERVQRGSMKSWQVHRRVAFPLPGVPLKFQWVRQRAYRERPETLGGHLRKRRCQSGLLQREVAAKLGVDGSTYLLWEQDRSQPTVRYYPAIYTFLGYEPFPEPTTLPERITAQRRRLGLTLREVSCAIGVDEGTFNRWETGEWKPRMSKEAVRRFLALPVPDRALNLEF